MSSQIISPFPLFTDREGEPLEAGYIYIGEVNQNPEVYPIPIYWDEELTQPAAQPVRTQGGYPARHGSPGIIYAEERDYSITVRDYPHQLVFTASSASTISPLEADLANTTDPTKGVSMVGGAERVVDTIADLRALPSSANSRVFVSGYYEPGDGGGGHYWLDESDNTSPDNGGTIIVATDNARWKFTGDEIDAKTFGAKWDGVSDDTLAVQAYVDWSASFTFDAFTGACRPTINFPAGKGILGTIQTDKRMAFRGQGEASTFIRLKDGVTTSLFVLEAEDVVGPSIDDANFYELHDVTLLGNRVDSVTQGDSHGVYLPDAPFPLATQYGPAIIMSNVAITGFTGDGVRFGVNRNWGQVTNLKSRYNNRSGADTSSYDNRFVNCDFGVCFDHAAKMSAGGANSFVGCNFYFCRVNLYITGNVNSPTWFVNCSVDGAEQHGVAIENSTGTDGHSFIGVRFQANSRDADNTYSDIYLNGPDNATVASCQFFKSESVVKYLVENPFGTVVNWVGNQYDASGGANTPFGTAVTDTTQNLIYAGDRRAYIFQVSAALGGVLGVSGPFKLKDYSKAALPSASTGANSIIIVTDDVGGLVPAFSDGSNWRRVTDRNVIS